MQILEAILGGIVAAVMDGVILILGNEFLFEEVSKLGGLYQIIAIFAILVLFLSPWIAVAKSLSS